MNDELCNEVSPSTSPGIRDPASVDLIKLLKLSRVVVVAVNIFTITAYNGFSNLKNLVPTIAPMIVFHINELILKITVTTLY